MSDNYELFVDSLLQLPEESLSDEKIKSLAKLQALYPGLDECCLIFQRNGVAFERRDDKIAVYYSRILLETDFKSFSYAFLTRDSYDGPGLAKKVIIEFKVNEGNIYTVYTRNYQEGWITQAELAKKRGQG